MTYAFIFAGLLLSPLWASMTPVYNPYQRPYAQLDPRYVPPALVQPTESADVIFQRVITNPKSHELTYQNFARFLLQQGISQDMIAEIQENIAKQQPDWQYIVADCLPERAVQRYIDGVRIHPTADVYIHLQKAQQSRKSLTWDVDFIGVWIIQYIEKYCTRPKVDLSLLRRDFQNMMRIIPEQYRDDFNINDVLQKLEASMIWQALVQTASSYISDTNMKWYKAAAIKKAVLRGKKLPKPLCDPWTIAVFEAGKFNALKDDKIINLWRNLQGVSGNFDMVVRSITAEIESLSREEVVMPLYQKNIAAFLRSISQQFQSQIQQLPLGVASWLYNQMDASLQETWQSGPHFQSNAFQQWRGDKESIDTLSVDGIQLAILGGIRDIEAKNGGRPQKIQEILRLLDAWKQRFQSVPSVSKIIEVIQSVESAVDDIVESASAWPVLAIITKQSMTPKGYQALVKEFPKVTKIPAAKAWEKVRKIKRPMMLPWGKANIEQLQKVAKPRDNNDKDVLSQFANQLFSQGASSSGISSGTASSSASQGNNNIDNNNLLQNGLKGFASALGLKI